MAQPVIPITQALIPLKHSLKQQSKFQKISDEILLNLKEIPELDVKSVELIEHICNLIEHYVKKKYKLDKENLLVYTIKRAITDVTDEDIEFVKKTVQYLLDNARITKVKMSQYVSLYAKKFLRSKLP